MVCVKLTSVSPVWICVAEALRRAGQSTTSTIDAIFPLRYAARTDPAIFSKHEMSTISTLGKVAVLEGKWDVKARSYPTYSTRTSKIEQHIEPSSGTSWTSAGSGSRRLYRPARQSIIQSRHFHYPSGNSFSRHSHINQVSYHNYSESGWHFGAERPGRPTTTLSYTSRSTDPMPWRMRALSNIFIMIWLTVVVCNIWGWWVGWSKVDSAKPTPSCWNIGFAIGPIYFGYGCQGWELGFLGLIII